MDVTEKLKILTDSAKYDVACTSSGSSREGNASGLGSTVEAGICHVFSADGRCVSLLKVLMSNYCIYDCKYCVNRVTNDVPRAAFTPRELAELTIGFYRRNYIEGLFLSSAVIRSPDYTMEQMIKALELLRGEYHFRGYIHAKTIPGADAALVSRMGALADRLSINIELPSEKSLNLLAPNKTKQAILAPMAQVSRKALQAKADIVRYKAAPQFAPAGQSTQMIIGASPESDYHILMLTEGLYKKYNLKRVFYSAYIPVAESPVLPALDTAVPLLREHRLYQADWLLRFYKFSAAEILDKDNCNFNPFLDPKCNWAVHNMQLFPVDINTCSYEMLLRVPGIGVKSAMRIRTARRNGTLDMEDLRRIGVVLKRAQYFIVCKGFRQSNVGREQTVRALIDPQAFSIGTQQLSMFDTPLLSAVKGGAPMLEIKEDAIKCLVSGM